ncbi:MAG TPA: LamG domain-containing protein, partial [Bacteroidales bacterium]|nr:LamG domain-containing protein [Bacteroidales bacterium]
MLTQVVLKRICFTLLLLTILQKASGSSYDSGNLKVEYDFCAGTVVITWVGYYDCDGSDDDEWCGGNLGIKIGTGSQFTVGTFGDGAGTYTGRINDENNYYNPAGGIAQDVTYWIQDSWWLYWRVTYKLSDSDFGKAINVYLTGEWDCGSEDRVNLVKTVTSSVPTTPSSLSASNNTQCDYVRLSWTNAGDRSCSISSYYTEIYRDGSLLTTVDNTANSYNDVSAVKGQSYTYKIRSKFVTGNSANNYSSFTSDVTGLRIAPLASPSSVAASSDNCAASAINLTWGWSATDPSAFQFQRSTNTAFTDATLSGEITGDKRSYTDTPPLKNTSYYYRMRTKNVCGDWSVWSSYDEGIAPAPPEAPSNVLATAGIGSVTVTWQDNSGSETGFIIERSMFGGGGNSLFNVGANITLFTDNSLVNCQMYSYEVKSKNACNTTGVASGSPSNAVLVPDISKTFTATNKLKASKGYYNDQVKLEWTCDNISRVEYFKIYRKIYGSASDSVLITSQNASTAIYGDNTAEPGIYYMYFIQAESTCNGELIKSNISSDIGFKSPTGIINGHIDYTGGIAVKNARVLVEKSSGSAGSSLYFDGVDDYVSVPDKTGLNPGSITIEAWIRTMTDKSDNYIFSKGTDYELYLNNKQPVFKLNNGDLNLKFAKDTIEPGVWMHIAATFDGTVARIYVNGSLKSTQAYSTAITHGTDSLIIGANSARTGLFSGYIDEVRIWKTARTASDIKRDYERILNGDETGSAASWGFDENVGEFVFDRSKTGVTFNENHGYLRNGPLWSDLIPTSSQLGYTGITDENGDYTINGVRYTLSGENFKLTPVHGTHKFSPTNRVVFIGTGSSIHNNMDFEDVSAFTVTGTVRFAKTTCYEKDVILNIDGEPVIKGGSIVMTDADGAFSIQVPIGEHFVTATKPGHEFSQGRFPKTGYYDFQAPVYGIEFADTTLRVVTGRVAGGLLQKNSSHVPGYGRNNIGQATITFKTQNGCYINSVTTADSSGQYSIALPPMKYTVPDFSITSNPVIQFKNNDLIDLSQNMTVTTEKDSSFVEGTSIVKHRGSIEYHKAVDFIYREVPGLVVTDENGKPFTGDSTFMWVSADDADTLKVNLKKNPFAYPVFSQNQRYKTRIKLFEEYVNKDNPSWVHDTVPVTEGKLTISNSLAEVKSTVINLTQADGDTLYTFRAGQPNTTINTIWPDRSYTETFQILAETESHSVEWTPLTSAEGSYFRGFILGARSSESQSFITRGPELVRYVLHDPPGNGSYSFREEGTSTATTSEFRYGGGIDIALQKTIKLGTKFSLGLGMLTETEVKNTLTLNLQEESEITNGGSLRTVSTTTENWQTSADPSNPGAGSDLFIGDSRNMIFGVSNNISIVKEAMCRIGLECYSGEIVQGADTFKIAKQKGFVMAPGDYATTFVYDRNHIENYLIPDLEDLRNQYFTKYPTIYVSKLSPDDPYFGTNNDDPVWGTRATSTDAVGTVAADYNGQSYSFNITTGKNDSIRIFNQQIRLWRETLSDDESLKAGATMEKNRSFNGGITYSYTYTSENTDATVFEYEVKLSEEAKLKVGAEIGGSGLEAENGIKLKQIVKGNTGSEDVTTSSYGYVLNDSDEGDYFSVDICKPDTTGKGNRYFGPVFKLKAGQSMCPNEGPTYSKYYKPGTLISGGTLVREVPGIDVAPATKINIPAGQAADFTLTLRNESESDDDMAYDLRIVQASNPFGAIIKVDGIDPARLIEVPAGSSVQKVLTVEKGPGDIYEYDSIAVVFTSPCQTDLSDTTWISAHFIPTCSDINLISPDNQWDVNNSFNDTLNIVLSGYNINFSGLEEIKLWYKPAAQSSWIALQSWFKDTAGMHDATLRKIPTSDVFTLYSWDLQQMNDGPYDIKATTRCTRAEKTSDILSGLVDRINPHPFGNPEPADGILSPGDEISIRFNEPIDNGLLTSSNFSITGVLNGTELRHDGFLYFDGINDYVEIADGLSLNSSFTVEFWVRRNNAGVAETFFSQGINENQSVKIGFDVNNKLKLAIAGISLASNSPFDNKWHHVACSYNKGTGNAEIFIDGSLDRSGSMITDYTEKGKILIGKSTTNQAESFKGYMHELRIWNKPLTLARIAERMNIQLSGNEFNLIGCWKMNEATGSLTKDIARSRNGRISGATWVVEPSGRSILFGGDEDYVEINSGTYAITDEMDFTLEFWFKNNAPADTVVFFSNGHADKLNGLLNTWMIFGTTDNHIRIMNDGTVFDAVTNNYFDNTWHHFAFSLNRKGNAYAYIDGQLQSSASGKTWSGIGSARFWVGARGWFTGIVKHNDKFFDGNIDEVRLWNLARRQEQIDRDRVNRLSGDEYGLIAYYPFERYTESMGILTLSETMYNVVDNTSAVKTGEVSYTSDIPAIKMERPVEKIPFTFSVNNDVIIFTPTIEPYRIENVTLDITARDVADLQGNIMASPRTWIAFVDRNQVVWREQELNFRKELNTELSFSTDIVNTGGELKTFSIRNLPAWLKVNNTEGTIEPDSYKTLTFTIDPSVNIGYYEEDVYVVTDFGYNEPLLLKLYVSTPSPAWSVDPSRFQFSMNVIGQLKINNVISTDTADMIGVFVND